MVANMGSPPDIRPARLARRIEIETPEQVTLGLELAGAGSRTLAALFDILLVLLLGLLASLAIVFSGVLLQSTWMVAVLVLVNFGIVWGYFALFEGLGKGRTPGKRRVGLRVIADTGHPLTFQAALIRNLIRVVDFQPGLSGLVGLTSMLLHPQGKRLGDIVAGTIVVRDEAARLRRIAPPVTASEQPRDTGRARLGGAVRLEDHEFQLLDRFLTRAPDLPDNVRERFARELATKVADRFPEWNPRDSRFLAEVRAAEQGARQAAGAAKPSGEAGRRLRVADRFVALRQDRWESFRARVTAVERRGLTELGGDELLRFAGEYRAVAADLARAVTYGVDPRTTAHLEGIVATGHNALYGMKQQERAPTRRLLLSQLPATVVRRGGYVAAATLFFLVPGMVGYALVRERPEVAREILPAVMLARAAAGQGQLEDGTGYAEAPSPFLPLVASSIIANNVQVAILAFATGVTAGIGTVLLLGFNGVFFGAVLGHFANTGLAGWILTFVAGHGVLELSAIFIAGGAGLLIGRAVLAPGDLARRDALVLHGRDAITMFGAAACLLVFAGVIEGLLSASDAAPAWKLGVSAASALLLILLTVTGILATRLPQPPTPNG
jgi:uncharacterized membrane protein SpoIIM required for sporulation/uncharacterized RDD family membrane protein YckC